MQLVAFALRRPFTILVLVVALALGGFLAVGRSVCEQAGLPYPDGLPKGMEVDVFPSLNLPVIYVCQPYGGMDPAQMEGYLTNYYEYHFLYITGIHHVESRNIQGVALMKLFFHPGTNMAQAMAETINYVNRSQAFMPRGTVSPFVMRFDTGSVPVGYLVLSSETRTIAEIQDLALFRVRPMFAGLPGVSAPPPFGGSQRTVVVTLDPRRLQSYGMSPEEVVTALSKGNSLSPSGNIPEGDRFPIVPVNSVVRDIRDLETIPIRTGERNTVYIRDVGHVRDFMDAPSGYALANGRRAVYILATKRADASTLSVIHNIRKAIPDMQAVLPDDIQVSFAFDQSPIVKRAVGSVLAEGALGALLVGVMVLLFLRDWRSAVIVIISIPLALIGSIVMLWLTGYTINLMTLGGLALAIGILVDEATVELENIHAQMQQTDSVAQAVRRGNRITALPRLLAMLCIVAVFLPAFLMRGAAGGLFTPLALAVAYAMISSYILSSTLVPVLAVWLLKKPRHHGSAVFDFFKRTYAGTVRELVAARWALVPAYLVGSGVLIWMLGRGLGQDIFPVSNAQQFRLRLRAPDGTHFAKTEQLAIQALEHVAETVGRDRLQLSLGYVGTIPSSYPINAVFQWSRGPEEAILIIGLRNAGQLETLKATLRERLTAAMPDVRFSFEASDIVNEVMSFGSATPVEIAVSGPNFADNRQYAEQLFAELSKVPQLRDVQYAQSLDYPTVEVNVDREKAGVAGLTPQDVSKALVAATSSSRFTMPNYWADPKSGIGYQVQVEVPRPIVRAADGIETVSSVQDLERLPLKRLDGGNGQVLVRDVARVVRGKMPGQFDRYNMRRQVSVTANIAGADLGTIAREISAAMRRAGEPPKGTKVETRGQIPPLREVQGGLAVGLSLAVVVVFLLLTASFQSFKLALAAVSTVPTVILGVVLSLIATRTTLNIQSFIGAIMAIGVAMANAILLVTFAERSRRDGETAREAAIHGAAGRLRAVLMTSLAMVAGMVPMALGWGEGGAQNAPLARAVIGGLLAATATTLLVLPSVFAILQSRAARVSPSLDPEDAESAHFIGGGLS